ncbi:putative membrane protein [Desulfofundulus luciae]|uniref:Membrane protein n=1 Tax=Desulfofundulus luciae TaxID=74702 RepID=A0ABU0B3X4_9FIRM|nr:SHOCT domain-containing protein [Desulfofundulus luciae]MDQ0287426.1 putative membrane protein [Desulfofundulus luciae]
MMYYGFGNWLGNLGWGLAMLLYMLLPLALLLGLIYLGFYLWERRNKNNVVTTGPDPVEVVKMRYARGEISAEEYHRLKEELRKE